MESRKDFVANICIETVYFRNLLFHSNKVKNTTIEAIVVHVTTEPQAFALDFVDISGDVDRDEPEQVPSEVPSVDAKIFLCEYHGLTTIPNKICDNMFFWDTVICKKITARSEDLLVMKQKQNHHYEFVGVFEIRNRSRQRQPHFKILIAPEKSDKFVVSCTMSEIANVTAVDITSSDRSNRFDRVVKQLAQQSTSDLIVIKKHNEATVNSSPSEAILDGRTFNSLCYIVQTEC